MHSCVGRLICKFAGELNSSNLVGSSAKYHTAFQWKPLQITKPKPNSQFWACWSGPKSWNKDLTPVTHTCDPFLWQLVEEKAGGIEHVNTYLGLEGRVLSHNQREVLECVVAMFFKSFWNCGPKEMRKYRGWGYIVIIISHFFEHRLIWLDSYYISFLNL